MFARLFIFSLLITLLHGRAGAEGASRTYSFADEWRSEVCARVTRAYPKRLQNGALSPKPDVRRVARVMQTSRPFASMALRQCDRHLSVRQAEQLAADANISPDYLLALDLLNRFATVEDLRSAVARDAPAIRKFLIDLYVNQRRPAPAPAPPPSLAARWRTRVNARLAELYPVGSSLPRKNRYGVNLQRLATDLGLRKITVGFIVNGPHVLERGMAERLAKLRDVDPEWLMATDVVVEAEDRDAFLKELSGEPPPLREFLLGLYDRTMCVRAIESPASR